ncbi:MAG: HAD hydrolase-like protein [Acetobacteraceae bacterium]|nr:HAD hydrolase-like protein [Acetobacteraceae bacterium]
MTPSGRAGKGSVTANADRRRGWTGSVAYRLAIFDFDGSLADSFGWFTGVINGLAKRHGFREIDGPRAEALRALGSREILAHLGVPLWKLPAIARDMRRLKAGAAGDIRLFEGVPELLLDLEGRGVAAAIVSSDDEGSVRRTLGPEAARSIAHFACGAALFGKAPKIGRVLRAAGVPPHRAIYIGDETRDAEAAAEAGVAFGAVAWGYAAAAALRACQPERFFTRVRDISGIADDDPAPPAA